MGWIRDIEKLKSIATIFSLIASPIIIAVLGWYIQKNISDEEIRKEYVKIAVSVLTSKSTSNHDLSSWAIEILDKESPVPFSSNLKENLLKEGLNFSNLKEYIIPHEMTQLGMNESACEEYNEASSKLNNVLNRIENEYRVSPEFIKHFKASQRAWLAYRDAELKMLYPLDRSQYGSVQPMCDCYHLAELTEKRVKDLQVWLDGIPEGDVCAGSIRFTE